MCSCASVQRELPEHSSDWPDLCVLSYAERCGGPRVDYHIAQQHHASGSNKAMDPQFRCVSLPSRSKCKLINFFLGQPTSSQGHLVDHLLDSGDSSRLFLQEPTSDRNLHWRNLRNIHPFLIPSWSGDLCKTSPEDEAAAGRKNGGSELQREPLPAHWFPSAHHKLRHYDALFRDRWHHKGKC